MLCPYRNITVLKGQTDEDVSKRFEPEGFPRTWFHWQQELDAYIADMQFRGPIKKDRLLYEDVLHVAPLLSLEAHNSHLVLPMCDWATWL